MRGQVQASDREYRAQVQAPDGEYHAQVQLCAASYDAAPDAPLNDAYLAEVVPHDRIPRTSQRCATGGDIYGQMYQGGDAVSKPVCGGFDSQLSVPEAG